MRVVGLNDRGLRLTAGMERTAHDLRVQSHQLNGGRLIDFGVTAPGSLQAGLALTQACMAGLCELAIVPGQIAGTSWPQVQIQTDHPVEACLLSQYAGWQIKVGKFFGMGSGPMRAVCAGEELFDRLGYREQAEQVIGVLEAGRLPDAEVFAFIAEKCGVEPRNVTLCVAPTASQAGNVQVVARSVETAMHKLYELGFDVWRVESGYGIAPLPPVAAEDMTGIGHTNDAILYGGRVTLWVRGDDDSIAEIGPRVPAVASDAYGKPFLEIFEEADRDFYKIDPHLFSPAEIVFQNLGTGRVHRFGRTNHDVLVKSFGL